MLSRFLAVSGLIAGLWGCGGATQDPVEVRTMRALAAGDSITYGAGGHYYGYRGFLGDLAQAAGITVQFVGSQTENLGIGDGHEGHPGWRSDEIQAAMPGWLERFAPDVVLLHAGTNDIYQGRPVSDATASIGATVDLVVRLRPSAWCLVATPGPFRSPKDAQAVELGRAIAELVRQRAAAGQNVRLVDVRAVLAASPAGLPALLDDSAHPSDLGYFLMARTWFEALREIRR